MSDVIDLIQATVRLEQPLANGRSTVGTGFVVTSAGADGAPRTLLITAHHVFDRMPGDKVSVGFRAQDAQGVWRFTPVGVRIRGAEGERLWTKHPTQDVAAIELPPGVAKATIPAGELPGERALETLKVRPGEEMMALGYPRGYSANAAGFPILRAGRVASYPLSPADRYPTYLVDFNVFAGNSGGPVYVLRTFQGRAVASQAVVTGLLTQQIKTEGDRLAIGNVTQADFIVEAIALAKGEKPAEVMAASGAAPVPQSEAASGPTEPSPQERLAQSWEDFRTGAAVLVQRAWIVVRDWLMARITRDARRVPASPNGIAATSSQSFRPVLWVTWSPPPTAVSRAAFACRRTAVWYPADRYRVASATGLALPGAKPVRRPSIT